MIIPDMEAMVQMKVLLLHTGAAGGYGDAGGYGGGGFANDVNSGGYMEEQQTGSQQSPSAKKVVQLIAIHLS